MDVQPKLVSLLNPGNLLPLLRTLPPHLKTVCCPEEPPSGKGVEMKATLLEHLETITAGKVTSF